MVDSRRASTLALAVGLSLASTSCGEPKQPMAPWQPTPSGAATEVGAASPFERWSLSPLLPTMGTPCDLSRPMSRLPDTNGWKCGAAGRVSMELVTLGLEPANTPPCTMRTLRSSDEGQKVICVSGDHLVLASACHPCTSAATGSVLHARLSELTGEQRDLLDDFIGVPRGTGPRSAAAWQALADSLPLAE